MAHVDWLTIVGRRAIQPTDFSVNDAYNSAALALTDKSPIFMESVGNPARWQIVKPRAPYSFARRSDDCTRTLYVHPLASHFTLEISGQYCQAIAQYIPQLLADFEGDLSRLDIAVDMETDVTPQQFDDQVNAPRIQTRSRMASSTGQTVYIGSRSSERFCRVYRYFEPHPRAHLLRAEFQLKGAYANQAAHEITEGVSINGIAAGLGQVFGFEHPCWNVGAEPVTLKVATHAQTGNTVYWLTNTVAPLLRRLQRESKLDVATWFDEYVMKHE